MANYIVSYDLNGSTPTHKQMDDHISKKGWDRGRILETVWYIGTSSSRDAVYTHINSVLSSNDSLIVISALDASWRGLLLTDKSLQDAWERNR